ncbi:MAG: protein kinase [Gemmataceae bacterium]|nr:protein kinase [Gemmataceae bacterium]
MAELWRCPQGHQWTNEIPTAPATCPVCGDETSLGGRGESLFALPGESAASSLLADESADGPTIGPGSAAVAVSLETPTIALDPAAHPFAMDRTVAFTLESPQQAQHEDRTVAIEGIAPPGPSGTIPESFRGNAELAKVRVTGYDILGILGRGGMGVVYKARQRGLNRLTALKMILAANHASLDDRLRFQAEAEAVAKLHHPNIVQIYEVGASEGHPYFSLEYVDGGTLSGQIENKPFTPRKAAEVTALLARAIGYAHQQGILHRDLKPGNILLSKDGTPKITDFGLAKQMGADASNQTGDGSILGTPNYMAPEQAEGRISELGPGVDIYALGALFYHLLTGRPPFVGQSVLDTLQQVRHNEPVPPSKLQPGVPRDLETIALKCLQKDIRKRYATAEELADDLGRFLGNEPIRARPVGLSERAWKWARRRPAVASLLATLLVVIVGGFFGMLGLWVRAEGLRSVAESNEQDAKNAKREADEATDVATRRLDESTRTLYASQMKLAQEAWHEAKLGRLRELLDRQLPQNNRGFDLRGFEWHYLDDLYRMDKLALKGHAQLIRAVAFRPPHAKELASASGDGSVVLWSPDGIGPQRFRFLKSHRAPVRAIAFSPNGNLLASAGEDGAIHISDAASGEPEPVRVLTGHRHGVNQVAFRRDGKQLASASDDGSVKIWNLENGAELATIKDHLHPVADVAFSSDGKRIATASQDRTVRVFDIGSPSPVFAPLEHDHWVSAVAFSPDGEHLASAAWDRSLRIVSARDGKPRMRLEGLASPARVLAFSPDSLRVAVSSQDNSVTVFDVSTRKILKAWPGEANRVRTIAFSPDGQLLASVDFDLDLRDAPDFQSDAPLLGVAFGGGGDTVGGVGADRQLNVWNLAASEKSRYVKVADGALRTIAFEPKASLWAVGGDDGMIRLCDVQGNPSKSIKAHDSWVRAVAFDPAGNRLASAGSDKVAKIWSVGKDSAPVVLVGHDDEVLGVAFQADGKLVATASADRKVRLWNAETGEATVFCGRHDGPIHAVAFSPAGTLFATASADRSIKLWDAAKEEHVATLRGHTHGVRSVVFSPDGKRIASASEDGTVKLWDPTTGQETLTLRGHRQSVAAIAFSPNGERLASVSWDQTLRIWNAPRR